MMMVIAMMAMIKGNGKWIRNDKGNSRQWYDFGMRSIYLVRRLKRFRSWQVLWVLWNLYYYRLGSTGNGIRITKSLSPIARLRSTRVNTPPPPAFFLKCIRSINCNWLLGEAVFAGAVCARIAIVRPELPVLPRAYKRICGYC